VSRASARPGPDAATRPARPGRVEILAVGLLFAAILVATFTTYARVPADELYHVSDGGLRGGLGRALVELNFPDGLIAVPLALVALDVLRTRWAAVLASVAIATCLVTTLPHVVDKADLDAKPVNAVPAAGVSLTIILLAAALPRLRGLAPRLPGDPARLALALALAVAAIPYIFAELGLYAPDPILADERTPGDDIAAVHLGSHEGMDGALLALGALALSRLPTWFAGRRLAIVTSTALALLLAYGVANLIQDDWLEQVVKRGWTAREIPSFVAPQLSLGWALVVAAAIAVEFLWFRRERRAIAAGAS
jgi:hypothetical protein